MPSGFETNLTQNDNAVFPARNLELKMAQNQVSYMFSMEEDQEIIEITYADEILHSISAGFNDDDDFDEDDYLFDDDDTSDIDDDDDDDDESEVDDDDDDTDDWDDDEDDWDDGDDDEW